MRKNPIYFWFDSPPKVGKGAFNFVANNWSEKVYFVFNNDFRSERKASHWDDGDFGKAILIKLYEEENPTNIIKNIFVENPSAIHIINGFTTQIMGRIKPYVCTIGTFLIVLSERPVQMGNPFERFLRNLYFTYKYRRIHSYFKKYVKAFLPLGSLGKTTFMKYGWDSNIMFPFMYNPQLSDISDMSEKTARKPLRFLYVGRFYYKTKGVDVLMKASQYLKGEWTLDLVGGYGKNADEIMQWAKNSSNVTYIGRWDSMEVTQNMQQYDVVVVPTKYDGWNLLVNEGLHAGIAVITTDEAVSHEVIAKSGAGSVVRANRPKELAAAMQNAIDNPEIVKEWKTKAHLFVPNISTPTVGRYMLDIINYVIYNEGIRPHCPWL